jgi:hypothetical protein
VRRGENEKGGGRSKGDTLTFFFQTHFRFSLHANPLTSSLSL